MNWITNISNFMSLKKPSIGFGFFSEEYSGDENTFKEGLEGELEGLYTGLMGRVASDKTDKFAAFVENLLQNKEKEQLGFEAYFCLWKKEDYSFFILAEFGSNDQVCSEVKKLVKDCAMFEESSVSVDELDSLVVPSHFKEDLKDLQK